MLSKFVYRIQRTLGYCARCQKYFRYPRRFRMLTQYTDEECNYSIGCKECRKEINADWSDLWYDTMGYRPVIDGVED